MSNDSDNNRLYTKKNEDFVESRECPLCGWETDKEILFDEQRRDLDERMERHYEDEHCGRVRVQVTLEAEWLLHPEQKTKDIGRRALERFEDEQTPGFVAAHSRVETLEEPNPGDSDA